MTSDGDHRDVYPLGQLPFMDIPPVKNTFLHVDDDWFPDATPLARLKTWPVRGLSDNTPCTRTAAEGADEEEQAAADVSSEVSTHADDAEFHEEGLLGLSAPPPQEAQTATAKQQQQRQQQLPQPLQQGLLREKSAEDGESSWVEVTRGRKKASSSSDSSEPRGGAKASGATLLHKKGGGTAAIAPPPATTRKQRQGPAASGGGGLVSEKHGGGGAGGGSRKRDGRVSRQIHVGIEDDSDFHVVKRLLGPGGKYVQDIVAAQGGGVKIVVLGGRSPPERHQGDGKARSCEPVIVSVSASGSAAREKVENAGKAIEELIDRVAHDYRSFLERVSYRRAGGEHAHAAGPSKSWRGGSAEEGRAPLLKCRYLVGIDDDSHFRVVHRLLGAGGENVQFIVAEAAEAGGRARVAVRGKGASRAASGQRTGQEGPLEVILEATTESAFERSCELVEDMLQDIQEQRVKYCRDRRMVVPNLAVKRDMVLHGQQ